MKTFYSLVVLLIIFGSTTANAQQAVQGSGLQEQASPSQQTAPTQNQIDNPQQSKADPFKQDQPSQLNVYSGPNQSSPALSVDAQTTTNRPVENNNPNSNLVTILTVAAIAGFFIGLYMLFSKKPGILEQKTAATTKTSKNVTTLAGQRKSAPKPKRKKTKSKKKKKAHR